MTDVSPFQDLQYLASLFGPQWARISLGIALDLSAFVVLAFDIRRLHREVKTEKQPGVAWSEKEARRRIADKQEELAKWVDASRGLILDRTVTFDDLRRQLGDQIAIQLEILNLIEAIRLWPIIEEKATTGKSVNAVGLAAVLFVAGITLQALGLVPT
ncbi:MULTISPECIES: hypothetical protein [unclassified Mesorhizobium]|uniref:hypothetical protein n=1 Tax=unclassified Mesorhizobium TaxID=325217 RepID=UPI000F755AA1|nr:MULTISPECIES: hypothetical protein [unclassified Mesorhizobium]AZO65823.1 hypothetical protein EJ075_13090 [Mesorhizobium sp. M6A.T.Cr.TU.016.01.1.1]RWP53518.1 MAG: hypothetical protein EOR06_15355 [Mesorhizobium sp.]RWQ66217.1 MAG: hypothetical protein EOS86_11670 [Mesorhizobium sp.]RWQ68895.1 MAG: hypothetical protein EOS85_31350 [Mesorhizobium sp.]